MASDPRELFYVPDGTYLLNHSVGCLTVAGKKAAMRSLEIWQREGGRAWNDWLAYIESFRTEVAKLIEADVSMICPQPNVSSGLNRIITALPLASDRSKIVLTEMDFPTVGYVCEHAKPEGCHVDYIKDADGRLPVELWEQSLTEDTWFTVITHAYSNNSFLADVQAICEICRQRGIISIVDIAQSAGVVPINVADWNADYIVGSSVKWLCGGSGACFLWANSERVLKDAPTDVGWFSSSEPFNYDIHGFSYAENALRFWGGTPVVATCAVAAASIRTINDIGTKRIRQHNQQLTEKLLTGAEALGLKVTSPADPAERGGTLSIDLSGISGVQEALAEANVFTDARARFGNRFSPHIYNSAEEIDLLLERLAACTRGT